MISRRLEDDVLTVVVDLDDLEVVGVAHELLEILRRNDVDLGGGQERFHADVDGETAFDHGLDLALDETFALGRPGRSSPSSGGRPSSSRGRPCPRRFPRRSRSTSTSSPISTSCGIFKFAGGDDAFALVSDVDKKFAGGRISRDVSFDDGAFAMDSSRKLQSTLAVLPLWP